MRSLVILLIFCTLCLWPVSLGAQSIFTLSQEVLIATPSYTLYDLLEGSVEASWQERLEDVVLGQAPGKGLTDTYSRQYLEYLLRQKGLDAAMFSIPDRVVVRSELKAITPEEVEEMIIQCLQERDPHFLISFPRSLPELQVLPGTLSIAMVERGPLRQPGLNYLQFDVVVEGEPWKTFRASVHLDGMVEVYVTARDLSMGHIVQEGDLVLMEKEMSDLPHQYFQAQAHLLGQRVRRNLSQGTILSGQHLEEVPLVERGQSLTIRVQGSSVVIDAPGEALEAGGIGSIIRVKNLVNNQTLQAKIISRNLVLIELSGKGS